MTKSGKNRVKIHLLSVLQFLHVSSLYIIAVQAGRNQMYKSERVAKALLSNLFTVTYIQGTSRPTWTWSALYATSPSTSHEFSPCTCFLACMRPSKARRTLAAAAVAAAKDPEEEAKEINERLLRASQEPRKGWWCIGIQTDRFQSDSVHVICSILFELVILLTVAIVQLIVMLIGNQ